MNYSRFGALCNLESAQAVAPLRGHTETAMCRHSRESRFANILTAVKVLCVILHERATDLCILYVLMMYLNNVLSCCKQ